MLIPFCWQNPYRSGQYTLLKIVSNFRVSVIVAYKYAALIDVVPNVTIYRVLHTVLLHPLVPIRPALGNHSNP